MLSRCISKFSSAVVLGMNDVLIGLTGSLVGFTLAMDNTRLIGLSGLIMGLTSSFSMAASSYLSHKELSFTEADKAGIATGLSYLVQALILVAPFFLLSDKWAALVLSLTLALFSMALYNYIVAREQGEAFWPRFLRMFALTGSVAVFLYFFTDFLTALLGLQV